MIDSIVREISLYFPSIYERSVEITPDKYMTALVRLDDGSVYIYDGIDRYIRRLPENKEDMSEDEFKKEFSNRLRRVMYVKRITQEVLAQRTGLSQAAISRYLSGYRLPNIYTIDKIARALDCPVDDLRYI